MKKISGFWLSPSYRCNNRCRWCYVGGMLSRAPEASLEEVKSYIDKMVQTGAKRCILVGGEPSFYPSILDVIAYATSKGVDIRMMSNGRKLASYDFVLELKRAGLTYCSVSLEGPEKIHDETTRVPGSFQES
ncbi:MAG: radical SAM protein, partial [Candidatus Staskawiczbacteria bacterium]|nr:radical SAM protein [Candidatus Staskawiczbacteria bacterium]